MLEKHKFSTQTTDSRQMGFDFGKKPLILAFGFEARSGKGECCDTIYKKHSLEHGGSYNILRISFATRLRDEIHDAMTAHWKQHFPGIARVHKDDHQLAMKIVCEWAGVEYDRNPVFDDLNPFGKQRKLQQWWGTELRRAENPRYWLNHVEGQIATAVPDVVLLDDLRFPNEHEWVRANGIAVKTTRLGHAPISNGIPGHVSEQALANHKFDYYITVNDGELAELRAMALEVFDAAIATR